MCSFCTEDCEGICELAQAAVLGAQTVYPMTTGSNQIASKRVFLLTLLPVEESLKMKFS